MNFVDQGASLHPDDGGAASFARPQPRILFVALVDNIGCERVIAETIRHGALGALLSPPGFYCTKAAGVSRHFGLPDAASVWVTALFVPRRLQAAVRAWQPDFVLPLDDISAWLLRSLAVDASSDQALRDLLVRSFGRPDGYAAAIHRGRLMDVAERLGVRKPRHWQVTHPADIADPAEADFPLFIKIDHTCGGDGVTAVNDVAEFRHRFGSSQGGALRSRAKTWLRSRLRSLAGFRDGADEGPLIQSLARGTPAFRNVVAWQGRVLAAVSFAAERIHPEPTGASTVIRFVENEEMAETAAAITAALGCSGLLSYDFMLDEERDQATLIEMNPRCVGSCHLGGLFGHDLCGSLVAALRGSMPEPSSRPAGTPIPKLIALFPKELQRDPDSPYLRAPEVLHDIPGNELDLINSYTGLLETLHPAQALSIRQIVQDHLRNSLLAEVE